MYIFLIDFFFFPFYFQVSGAHLDYKSNTLCHEQQQAAINSFSFKSVEV